MVHLVVLQPFQACNELQKFDTKKKMIVTANDFKLETDQLERKLGNQKCAEVNMGAAAATAAAFAAAVGGHVPT